ncbi:hypothetical protein SSX86_012639 [Deinandra increscens subsp. villosa]|uniref:PGG domain-containing protein n=1 Tax=Deinandra increscens subsp. villosa TaxID=3103831 RepID=A0AAP0D902_9ASTR
MFQLIDLLFLNTVRSICPTSVASNFTGSREDYLKIGIPLFEASIQCNWKAAEAIFLVKRELVRHSITEFGETPLHIAASAKGDRKRVQEFVKKLVGMMREEDLELENKNHNTPLYLAVVAGNVETVKIMVHKNRKLLTIPGAYGAMMPLYAAVVFGNKDVAEYIYEESNILSDEDGWDDESRGWLLEKCVEKNMLDMALKIVKKHANIDAQAVLGVLAERPKAFLEREYDIMVIIKSVFAFIRLRRAPKRESNALQPLRHIWDATVKKSKREIDEILRGPPDWNEQDNLTLSGWNVQVLQLQNVISEHVTKLNDAQKYMITRMSQEPYLTKSEILQHLISQSIVNIHVETQNIMKSPMKSIMEENSPVSYKERLALELQKLIFKNITDLHDTTIQKTRNTIMDDQQVLELEKVISDHTEAMVAGAVQIVRKYERLINHRYYSSRVLFVAAKVGNTKFLVELIRQYPDLIWKVDDNNQSIFHTAIKYRQEGVYSMLHEIGSMKDMIILLKDPKNNHMLHLVGKIIKHTRLEEVSGVALQMQLELLWFHEVKELMRATMLTERKNDDGLTGYELFAREHKDLLTQSEKWMKGTASQSMVVAALIATIVFAATFTVPGGYDQENGLENLCCVVTTLGKGGSDLATSTIGKALGLQEIQVGEALKNLKREWVGLC